MITSRTSGFARSRPAFPSAPRSAARGAAQSYPRTHRRVRDLAAKDRAGVSTHARGPRSRRSCAPRIGLWVERAIVCPRCPRVRRLNVNTTTQPSRTPILPDDSCKITECEDCGCSKNEDHTYGVVDGRVGFYCRMILHKNKRSGPCRIDHNVRPDNA